MTHELDSLDLTEIAFALEEARRSATPVDLITSRFPELTWDNARAIARSTDQLRVESGETQVGWKLGWTSQAMRDALGIDQPNWGTLWDTQIGEAEIALDALIHPKVEPELVWRAPVDLPNDVDAAGVAELGGSWAWGVEVVDPRFPSFDFLSLDNTADNSSSAAIRVGEFSSIDADPSELTATFSDGSTIRTGAGSQTMGSPWEAIAWLCRSLGNEGLGVRSHDIVFTGGLTAPFDADRGCSYLLAGDPLEPVDLTFI